MNVKNKNMTYKHVYENMNTWLDVRLWCSNVIKKYVEKRIATWGEADFMLINPFYDTWY